MSKLIKPTRRGFITGLISLVTAPAIVRASSLMPVKNMYIGHEPMIRFYERPSNQLYPQFRMDLLEYTADNIRMFMLGDVNE